MANQTAAISEIFSSLQGEGTHLGERHLFLRFEACNIHCDYCDELGKSGFDFDLNSTLESLKRLDRELGPHVYVSLTGGEPLLYVSFLKILLPELKKINLRAYLETSGILWKPLQEIVDWIDVVAMDVKPASVTKERSFINEHEEFLKISLKKETFIKMICSKEIDLEEFKELCLMIKDLSLTVPLILQPISGEIEGHDDPALMSLLGELQTIALGMLKDVRIVPRLHKILKIR
jgi:organic radical activating enzyme